MSKKLLIDVRTINEFTKSHKYGAINIPVEDIASGNIGSIGNIDKDSEIELYCLSGARAELAKDILESLGYTNVTNIGGFREGGYVGLLVLLITVCIITIIMVRSDIFSGSGNSGKTVIERDLEAVDKAREAKTLLESLDRRNLQQ